MKRSTKGRSLTRTSMLAAATLSVAAIPTMFGAGAASASPTPWESVHVVYDPPLTIENFCRTPGLTVVASGWIDYRDRTTTRGGLPYYSEHTMSFLDTFTNADTGAFLTNTGTYSSNTISVVDNGDGTLTITSQYKVNTQIADDAGRVVSHDTGIYRYLSIVDHAGTPSDPTDDTELDSSDLLKTGLQEATCAELVAALT
jgi:hypothetical protein